MVEEHGGRTDETLVSSSNDVDSGVSGFVEERSNGGVLELLINKSFSFIVDNTEKLINKLDSFLGVRRAFVRKNAEDYFMGRDGRTVVLMPGLCGASISKDTIEKALNYYGRVVMVSPPRPCTLDGNRERALEKALENECGLYTNTNSAGDSISGSVGGEERNPSRNVSSGRKTVDKKRGGNKRTRSPSKKRNDEVVLHVIGFSMGATDIVEVFDRNQGFYECVDGVGLVDPYVKNLDTKNVVGKIAERLERRLTNNKKEEQDKFVAFVNNMVKNNKRLVISFVDKESEPNPFVKPMKYVDVIKDEELGNTLTRVMDMRGNTNELVTVLSTDGVHWALYSPQILEKTIQELLNKKL